MRKNGRIDEFPSVGIHNPRLAIFPTDLGWFGLLGTDRNLIALSIGHAGEEEVRQTVAKKDFVTIAAGIFEETDWNPELRRRLQSYALGEPMDFADCHICLPRPTPFRTRVVTAARRIGFGRTLTYGELAKKAGSLNAARAVGSVMASNWLPIIVPCHRVVAASGGLGGFSAPQGIALKQRMLELESAAVAVS